MSNRVHRIPAAAGVAYGAIGIVVQFARHWDALTTLDILVGVLLGAVAGAGGYASFFIAMWLITNKLPEKVDELASEVER